MRRSDVISPLWVNVSSTGDLALDGERAAVSNFLQALDEGRKVDLALADGHFAPQLARAGGVESVLGVDSLHQRAENVEGVNRIGLAVKDEVGGVEVHADVVEAHVMDGAVERDGRFLAGFAAEVLAVAAAVVGHGADGLDGFLVDGIVRIFGDESAVGLDGWDAALFGEIRGLLDLRDARVAVFARHQADSEWTFIEVVDLGAGAARDQRSGLDLVLVEGGAQSCGHAGVEGAHARLAGGDAEAVDFANGGFGIAAGGDDEAELEAGGGGGRLRFQGQRSGGRERDETSAGGHVEYLSTMRGGGVGACGRARVRVAWQL